MKFEATIYITNYFHSDSLAFHPILTSKKIQFGARLSKRKAQLQGKNQIQIIVVQSIKKLIIPILGELFENKQ